MLHKDVVLLSLPIFTPTNMITKLYDIMAKHCQHFKTTQGYFSVRRKAVFFSFFTWKRSDFFRKLEINLSKVIGIDGFGYRQEFEQFCLLFFRCREPKEMSALDKCFWGDGYAWNLLSRYDDDATISYNNENRNSLRASSSFKGYREKSRASGTQRRRESKVWE